MIEYHAYVSWEEGYSQSLFHENVSFRGSCPVLDHGRMNLLLGEPGCSSEIQPHWGYHWFHHVASGIQKSFPTDPDIICYSESLTSCPLLQLVKTEGEGNRGMSELFEKQ